MKNLALTLAMAVLLTACSSGSTVAPLPSTVNSQFVGSFKNVDSTQSGTVRFDIAQDDGGGVAGNMIITNDTNVICIANGTVSGLNNGFNITLTSAQTRARFKVVTTRTRVTGTDDLGNPILTTTINEAFRDSGREGTTESDDGNGNRTTIVTTREDVSGNINIQLAISNNGNTIAGTYIADAQLCSNSTGTGDMTLNRT